MPFLLFESKNLALGFDGLTRAPKTRACLLPLGDRFCLVEDVCSVRCGAGLEFKSNAAGGESQVTLRTSALDV